MKKIGWKGETITIFEYEEAKELIKSIAIENAGDTTTVARGGRGRNKIEYYNYPCAFDIETTTIKPGELDYKAGNDAPPIGFPYLFQFNIYDRVIMVRTYREAMNIFNWLSYYFRLALNRRLIIFVHNLSYEYHFFKDLWEVEPEACFALDERHPATIVTKNGLMFRDSYKMTNMSLETLTKDYCKHYIKEKEIMDYSKLRTPYNDLDDNTLIYSALDVLSLSEAIKSFLKARNEGIWTNCPTSTSFIRKALKKEVGINVKAKTPEQIEYQRILRKQTITPDILKLLTKAARGGNTHANRAITGKLLKDCAHFDICSSYPAQMVCYPEYPIAPWRKLDPGAYIETIELFERNRQCTLFDLVLINPRLKPGVTVPYISISRMIILKGEKMKASDNGRYMDGLEQIEITLFGCEWWIIKEQYDYDDAVIVRGYFAQKGYMPDIIRRFVLELYDQKSALKGIEEKAIEYAISKSYLNGCFGMAMTSIKRPKYKLSTNGIVLEPEEDIEKALIKYQRSKSYFLPYAWGCIIAALGRCYLQRMIDTVGENFAYCDTDSVFATNAEESKEKIRKLEKEITEYQRKCGLNLISYDIKGNAHELGAIDEEAICDLKTFGAKKYITVENEKLKCTVAGVPKKKGAEIIGSPENFKIGLNFEGAKTGKMCLWYNEAPGFKLHDNGREIEVYSNIAMLPCDYLLSLSADYTECLSIEGNFHWNFKEADKNVLNEEDY